MHSREMRRVKDRAPTNRIEVGYRNRRFVIVNWVVGGSIAKVRTDGEVRALKYFPISFGAGVFRGVHPSALLKAKNLHLRLG